jgi:hypothetical protein
MSFEDLEEAKAKRAEKGRPASVSKSKRGRGGERKSNAVEGRPTAPPLPEPAHALVLRASVARMY